MGNIAADPLKIFRNKILDHGGLLLLIKIMKTPEYKFILETGVWVLKILCECNPPPNYELVKEAIPFLAKVVIEEENQEILADAISILANLSDDQRCGGNGAISIQYLIDSGGLIGKLLSLLKYIP